MLVRCLPASVQSARSVFEKNTHDLRAFHSTTDSTNSTDASLGIGFQPNLPSIQLNHKTTNQSGTQYQASDNP